MKVLITISFLSLMFFYEKVKVWKENKGVVIVEAEHVQNRNALPPYWQLERSIKGFEKTGFVQWKGLSLTKDTYDEIDEGRILTFYISIEQEGNYYLKTKGICLDELEADLLVRINNNEWKKFTITNDGKVNWDNNPMENSYPIFLPLGYHKIEVAGITSGFLLDKFILAHGSLFTSESFHDFVKNYNDKKESRNEYVVDENFPLR